MRAKSNILEIVEVLLWVIVSISFALQPFIDPDLGWHLAGGMSIISQARLPHADLFLIGSPYWWDYSWLVQVILAQIYLGGSFAALRIVQVGAVATLVLLLVFFSRALVPPNDNLLQRKFAGLVGLIFGLLMIFPAAYLRPPDP